MICLAKLYI